MTFHIELSRHVQHKFFRRPGQILLGGFPKRTITGHECDIYMKDLVKEGGSEGDK